MFFAYHRKIFSDLWWLVGRRMLHPQRGGSICEIFASLEMPPHSLSCWHCSPDNEDEGWYYWQHTEAGKDQLIILQEPNTNTGPAKYLVMRLKKHFQLQSSLQEWDSNKCPAVKWVLHFKICSTLNICFEIWQMILREGWRHQIKWVFGKVKKGGGGMGLFQSKHLYCIFWTFIHKGL